MSVGVSAADSLFQALKLTDTAGNDSLTTTVTTASSTTPSLDPEAFSSTSKPLREKTNLLRGKTTPAHRRSGDAQLPPHPLASLSKIDDAHLSVVTTTASGTDGDARSLSWPSADKRTLDVSGGGGEEGEEDRQQQHPVIGHPSSWPSSPLVKTGPLFNKDTTFKEGLGIPINYAEGRNSLTHVLESIHLCYNPSSKQLHRFDAAAAAAECSTTMTTTTTTTTISSSSAAAVIDPDEARTSQQPSTTSTEECCDSSGGGGDATIRLNDNLDCDRTNDSSESGEFPPSLATAISATTTSVDVDVDVEADASEIKADTCPKAAAAAATTTMTTFSSATAAGESATELTAATRTTTTTFDTIPLPLSSQTRNGSINDDSVEDPDDRFRDSRGDDSTLADVGRAEDDSTTLVLEQSVDEGVAATESSNPVGTSSSAVVSPANESNVNLRSETSRCGEARADESEEAILDVKIDPNDIITRVLLEGEFAVVLRFSRFVLILCIIRARDKRVQ